MSKTKLFEILAVEQGLAKNTNAVLSSVKKNFGRIDLFSGVLKKHEIFAEDQQHKVLAPEVKKVVSTVDMQLNFLFEEVAPYWNVYHQKESANQLAKADIVVDGQVIFADVPTVVLLGMEKKLEELLKVYNTIPTLDSAVVWQEDTNELEGVWRGSHPEERIQAVIKKDWKEVSPATQHHKAQLAEVETKEEVGKFIVTPFSGAIPSHDKAARIARLTKLVRAVKQARMRANSVEVPEIDKGFAKSLFDYINTGK